MANAKQTKRAVVATTPAPRRKAAAARSIMTDVTLMSAEAVIGHVKLTCDNDTNVVFIRQNGKLFMSPVQRS